MNNMKYLLRGQFIRRYLSYLFIQIAFLNDNEIMKAKKYKSYRRSHFPRMQIYLCILNSII